MHMRACAAYFASCRKISDIALQVQLASFAFRRSGQSNDSKYPGTHPFRDALDHPPFASSIAAFEHHDDTFTRGDEPLLEFDQFSLQIEKGCFVSSSVESLLQSLLLIRVTFFGFFLFPFFTHRIYL